MSAIDSISQPATHKMMPRTSLAVPNAGATPLETAGEFNMMTGSETTQTFGGALEILALWIPTLTHP